ncbi:MAG: hypothetical protein HC859_00725 [Bacteroidia bacterium]|nr:hypothetical protein [Bacteroidia bacterium]
MGDVANKLQDVIKKIPDDAIRKKITDLAGEQSGKTAKRPRRRPRLVDCYQ